MNNYIPFQLRSLVTQIDPFLDLNWQFQLKELFSTLNKTDQDNLYQQILRAKSIKWNIETNEFTATRSTSLSQLKYSTLHQGMQTLIKKIQQSLKLLESYTDATDISDYLESLIKQIDLIDVEENIELQRLKQKIRQEFIYDAAELIRQKVYIAAPQSSRQLDSDVIKSFILEVFLKHQLLSYWFKTLRPRQLRQETSALLNQYLRKEQKIRQLEIIKTSQYIFAIAPSRHQDINPFSIRRFLSEEKITHSQHVYVNGAFIGNHALEQPEQQEHFKWQINHIVTVEKPISQLITDLIDHFERINADILVPLLFSTLDSSGIATDKISQQRLWDFEQRLSLHILEPLQHALRNTSTNQDEHDFLFVSIRQIMTDIISYYRDFQIQPAMLFDKNANMFAGRLVAYLNLIEKRRVDLFTVQTLEDYDAKLAILNEPIHLLKVLSKDALDRLRTLRIELKDSQKLLKQKENSFFSKIFHADQKMMVKIDDLKSEILKLKDHTYLEIIRIPKKFPNFTVYLEFESLISINQLERHYAFSSGQNWIKRLPLLVQLPEDRSLFNIQEVYNTLEFDLSKMNQKWTDTV